MILRADEAEVAVASILGLDVGGVALSSKSHVKSVHQVLCDLHASGVAQPENYNAIITMQR
jgi:hypothetical protein